MTTESETILQALGALNRSGAEYMIVGSYAASIHGFTRATHDLDIVISLRPTDIGKLAAALGDEFFLDVQSAIEAVGRGDMFNAIHVEGGIKVDFWILGEEDFARTQFSRRQATELEGRPAWVESAEDTVLSKLLWYKATPSDRQLADVKGILDARSGQLDWTYLDTQAKTIGVDDLLSCVKNK